MRLSLVDSWYPKPGSADFWFQTAVCFPTSQAANREHRLESPLYRETESVRSSSGLTVLRC